MEPGSTEWCLHVLSDATQSAIDKLYFYSARYSALHTAFNEVCWDRKNGVRICRLCKGKGEHKAECVGNFNMGD